jgi:thiamine pyrophosphate-dependent acetolactate synthase large subunit-like protein
MNDGSRVVKKIATDLLIERPADWGVDTVFGLPGDGRWWSTTTAPHRATIASTLFRDKLDQLRG